MAKIVGQTGQAVAVHAPDPLTTFRLRSTLAPFPQSSIIQADPTTGTGLDGPFDAIWLGAALPRLSRGLKKLLAVGHGSIATCLGPRFRPKDLVCVTRRADQEWVERILGRVDAPILKGAAGWLRP